MLCESNDQQAIRQLNVIKLNEVFRYSYRTLGTCITKKSWKPWEHVCQSDLEFLNIYWVQINVFLAQYQEPCDLLQFWYSAILKTSILIFNYWYCTIKSKKGNDRNKKKILSQIHNNLCLLGIIHETWHIFNQIRWTYAFSCLLVLYHH